jgi:hypothetical protein
MCRLRLAGHRVNRPTGGPAQGREVPECLPAAWGALHADPAQTEDQSPFHPLYLRRPGTFPLLVAPNHGITGGAQGDHMTHIPFLFNQTIEQMRRIGARGGRTHARNWQARQRAAGAGQRETGVPVAPPRETTTQAVAVLDAQFAWLRGAEKPGRQRRTGLPNSAQR